jgi:hypothetical protein
MSKALVRVVPDDWNMLKEIAQTAYESGSFGATKGESAIKLLFCFEHGLPLSAANQGLFVVNRQIAAMGQIAASQIRRHPDYDYKVEKLDTKGCTIAIYRHGELEGRASFTEADAERAGLLSKNVWKFYPEDMYFNRAIGRAQRRFAPDALGIPVYTAEELDEETTVATTWTVQEPDPTTTTPAPEKTWHTAWHGTAPKPSVTTINGAKVAPTETKYDSIAKLIAHPGWTPDRIMAANKNDDGVPQLPATAQTCQEIAEKLEKEDNEKIQTA